MRTRSKCSVFTRAHRIPTVVRHGHVVAPLPEQCLGEHLVDGVVLDEEDIEHPRSATARRGRGRHPAAGARA